MHRTGEAYNGSGKDRGSTSFHNDVTPEPSPPRSRTTVSPLLYRHRQHTQNRRGPVMSRGTATHQHHTRRWWWPWQPTVGREGPAQCARHPSAGGRCLTVSNSKALVPIHFKHVGGPAADRQTFCKPGGEPLAGCQPKKCSQDDAERVTRRRLRLLPAGGRKQHVKDLGRGFKGEVWSDGQRGGAAGGLQLHIPGCLNMPRRHLRELRRSRPRLLGLGETGYGELVRAGSRT